MYYCCYIAEILWLLRTGAHATVYTGDSFAQQYLREHAVVNRGMSNSHVTRDEIVAQTSSLQEAVRAVFQTCQQVQAVDGAQSTRTQQELSQECMAVLASEIAATLSLCQRCSTPKTRKQQLEKEIADIESELRKKVFASLFCARLCCCLLPKRESEQP